MSAALALVETTEDRLLRVAVHAICNPERQTDLTSQWNQDRRRLMEIAMSAIRNEKIWDGAKDALFRAVRNDPDLLWVMFGPFRMQAAQRVLSEAAMMVRAEDIKPLPVQENPHTPSPQSQSAARAAMAAVASIARVSLLDTFKINGKSLGDCTPAEANKWADKRATQARFVHLLTQNLPPDEPIRKWRRPEDVDAAMEQAQQDGRSE